MQPCHTSRERGRAPGLVRMACLALALLLSAPVQAEVPAHSAEWEPLIARLVSDGLVESEVREYFQRPEVVFLPHIMGRKLSTLFRRKFGPKSPAGGKAAGPAVYENCLSPFRIFEAAAFMRDNAVLLAGMRRAYGVPEPLAVALLSVETRVGNHLGDESAFVTLAGMALIKHDERVEDYVTDDMSEEQRTWLQERAGQKADWAYDELKALIQYARAGGQDPVDIKGSVYGAIGICQFMPTNALRFGRDGNGDGKVDLFRVEDAVFSLGNFLKANGWKKGLSLSRQRRVLYRYNPSRTYANTVLALADKLR